MQRGKGRMGSLVLTGERLGKVRFIPNGSGERPSTGKNRPTHRRREAGMTLGQVRSLFIPLRE
jgi:hypothetical protein